MENYFASQRDNIFRNVEVLIYVFDVESDELGKLHKVPVISNFYLKITSHFWIMLTVWEQLLNVEIQYTFEIFYTEYYA